MWLRTVTKTRVASSRAGEVAEEVTIRVHLAVATMVHEVEEEVDMAEALLKITIMTGRLIRRVVTEVKVAVVVEDEVEEITEVIEVAMEATEVIEVAMEAQEAEAVVAPGRTIALGGVASQSCARLRLNRLPHVQS